MKLLKKRVLVALLTAALMLLASCTAQSGAQAANDNNAANDKLLVYTSFYPIYDFASQIGGDRVELVRLITDGSEPHSWEPQPADIVGLEKADVFIYNGAGMETWVDKVLSSLQNKELAVVDTSSGIQLIAAEHHHDHEDEDHDEGEEHDEDETSYDPHIWLSLRNAKKQAESINNALAQADSDNAEYYNDNYNRFAQELDALDAEFTEALRNIVDKNVVVSHQAFAYLCKDYGLTQIAVEGLTPDSEPDAARMVEIIEFCKQNNVKTIFFEELASEKVAQTISKATGVSVSVLTAEQSQTGEDYLGFMRANLRALTEGLQ